MYKSCTECMNMTRLHAEFAEVMHHLISSILQLHGIKVANIEKRVKGVDSFRIKCVAKQEEKTFYRHLRQVPDLVGFRILLYYSSDVDTVTALLRGELHVHEERDVEKQYSDEKNAAYRARHLVLSPNHRRISMPEYALFHDLRCEVQITTLLEQSWSGIEHDLLYKRREALSDEERTHLEREFAQIAKELRRVDATLDRLRKRRNPLYLRLLTRVLARN